MAEAKKKITKKKPGSPEEKEGPTLDQLLESTNEAAKNCRNVYLFFLLVAGYLALILWGINHEALLRETLGVARRVLGPEHQDTLRARSYLAYAVFRQGHFAEAEPMFRETLEIQRRVLGTEHQDTWPHRSP